MGAGADHGSFFTPAVVPVSSPQAASLFFSKAQPAVRQHLQIPPRCAGDWTDRGLLHLVLPAALGCREPFSPDPGISHPGPKVQRLFHNCTSCAVPPSSGNSTSNSASRDAKQPELILHHWPAWIPVLLGVAWMQSAISLPRAGGSNLLMKHKTQQIDYDEVALRVSSCSASHCNECLGVLLHLMWFCAVYQKAELRALLFLRLAFGITPMLGKCCSGALIPRGARAVPVGPCVHVYTCMCTCPGSHMSTSYSWSLKNG